MLAVLLAMGLARAHPFTAQRATQAHALRVGPDRVELTYRADVPTAFITTSAHSADRDPLVAMQGELASGLVLLADGAVVPLHPVGTWPDPVRTSEHTFGFTLELSAQLDSLPDTLELQTANLQDATNFVSGTVDTLRGVRVVDTNLWARTPDGIIARNDRGRWRRDARTLTVTLSPPVPGWGWVSPQGPRPAWEARVRGPREAIASGTPTPGIWLLSAMAAITLGAAAARPELKTGVALVAAVGVTWIVSLLTWADVASPWIDGSLSAALLALVMVCRRRPLPWLWSLAAAALVVSMHDPVTALGVAFAAAAGMAARSATLSGPWIGAALVAAWLALRCAGALTT